MSIFEFRCGISTHASPYSSHRSDGMRLSVSPAAPIHARPCKPTFTLRSGNGRRSHGKHAAVSNDSRPGRAGRDQPRSLFSSVRGRSARRFEPCTNRIFQPARYLKGIRVFNESETRSIRSCFEELPARASRGGRTRRPTATMFLNSYELLSPKPADATCVLNRQRHPDQEPSGEDAPESRGARPGNPTIFGDGRSGRCRTI